MSEIQNKDGKNNNAGNKAIHIPVVSGQEYYTIPLRVDKETYEAIKSGKMSAISIRGINSEIKPANTVKAMKIEYRTDDPICIDKCFYSESNCGSRINIRIGSYDCGECQYNKDISNDRNSIYCSKYTEEQAKAQNLKYSIV
jgi:hypothetical protein